VSEAKKLLGGCCTVKNVKMLRCSSVGRAVDFGSTRHRFEPCHLNQGRTAQLNWQSGEILVLVFGGSSPPVPTEVTW
jgi:hypothetical protein